MELTQALIFECCLIFQNRQPVIKRKTSNDPPTCNHTEATVAKEAAPVKDAVVPPGREAVPTPGGEQVSVSPGDNSHDLAEQPWFYGKMSRQTCENIFNKRGRERDYFIRESTNRVRNLYSRTSKINLTS